MLLRRITLAAALALLPAVRAATDFGDWLRDSFADDSLWLYGAGGLAFEAAPADLPPRTPAKRWLYARDGQPAAVVYFVPGSIRAIEVDTHRRPGASGDFTLSTSADGRQWQPLSASIATLEEAAGWQYRLLAADSVPGDALHLRVEFPAGATADTHRLTEVWIRFEWEPALLEDESPATAAANVPVSPPPVPPPAAPSIVQEATTVFVEPSHPVVSSPAPEPPPVASPAITPSVAAVPAAPVAQTPRAEPPAEANPPAEPSRPVAAPRAVPPPVETSSAPTASVEAPLAPAAPVAPSAAPRPVEPAAPALNAGGAPALTAAPAAPASVSAPRSKPAKPAKIRTALGSRRGPRSK